MVHDMKQVAASRGFDETLFLEWAETNGEVYGAFREVKTNNLLVGTWDVDTLLAAAYAHGFTRVRPYI